MVEFRPRTFTPPDLVFVTYCYYYYSSPPHLFFSRFLDCFFCFSLLLEIPPIAPFFSPVNATYVSIFTRFFPHPLLPSRGATIHLDGAPSRRPPRLVCTSLLFWLAQRSSLCDACLTYPVRFPPLDVFDLCPGPCRPQGSPIQGSLPPSVISINLTPSPPLSALTGGPAPCWYREVAYFSSSPCPLSPVRLPIPTCVTCCILVSSEVIPFWCPFARKLEAWDPPLPGNSSPKPLPPR